MNKVSTKVHIFIRPGSLGGLTDRERDTLRRKLASCMNHGGELHVSAQQERTQELNRAAALRLLEKKIEHAVKIPAKRIKTKPTHASKEKRIKGKKLRSAVKQSRGRPSADDSGS